MSENREQNNISYLYISYFFDKIKDEMNIGEKEANKIKNDMANKLNVDVRHVAYDAI